MNNYAQVFDSDSGKEGVVPLGNLGREGGFIQDNIFEGALVTAHDAALKSQEWSARGRKEYESMAVVDATVDTWLPLYSDTQDMGEDVAITVSDNLVDESLRGTYYVARNSGVYQIGAYFDAEVYFGDSDYKITSVELAYSVTRREPERNEYTHECDVSSYIKLDANYSQLRPSTLPRTFEEFFIKKWCLNGCDIVPLYVGDSVRFWYRHNARETAMWLPADIPQFVSFNTRATFVRIKSLIDRRSDVYDGRR